MNSHAAVAAEFGFTREDWKKDEIYELSMLAHAITVNGQDIKRRVKNCQKYWSDEAVNRVITVIALFNFYNKWVDGHGVAHMSPEQYLESGKRLKERGYLLDLPEE